MQWKLLKHSWIVAGIGIIAIVCVTVVVWSGRPETGYRPGFSCRSFRTEMGESVRYILFLPHVSSPDEPKPVLLFLNGYGENGSDGIAQLSNNLGQQIWDTRGRFPFILVAPQMSNDSSWTDPRSTIAAAAPEIVRQVIIDYGGDPDRVYLTGPSIGGSGAVALANRHSNLFAAVVPVATGSLSVPHSVPLWAFVNSGDSSQLVESAVKEFANLLNQGQSPLMTVFEQGGHDAWTNAYSNPALYDWLLRQNNTPSTITSERYLLIDVTQMAALGLDVDPEQHVIKHRNDSPNGELFLGAQSKKLHFQYRSTGKTACLVTGWRANSQDLPKRDVLQQELVLQLSLPWPEDGSPRLLYDGYSTWGDALAQRAIRADQWNDVRIEMSEERCAVFLNGWILFDQPQTGDKSLPLKWGLTLQSEAASIDQDFRYLRVEDYPRDASSLQFEPQIVEISSSRTPGQPLEEISGQSLHDSSSDQELAVSQIINGWQALEAAWDRAALSWRRKDPSPSMTWLDGEYPVADWQRSTQRLRLDGRRFEILSMRPYTAPHLGRRQVAGPVALYLRERSHQAFLTHLHSRFSIPDNLPPVQPFMRVGDNQQVLDWWQPTATAGSRAIIRPVPQSASEQSVLLQMEEHLNDRGASLEFSGGLMALRPLTGLLHLIDDSKLKIDSPPCNISGIECVRLFEQFSDSNSERLWFVARQYPHPIVRYLGTTDGQGVQLDIFWNGDGLFCRPIGWQYQLFRTDGSPTNLYGQVAVEDYENRSTEVPATIDLHALPEDTWLVDMTAVQDHSDSSEIPSYLIKTGGQRRFVTAEELSWLPTQIELRRTNSGQVGRLIARKIFWRRLIHGDFAVESIALFSGTLVAVFLVTRLLRRRSPRRKIGDIR